MRRCPISMTKPVDGQLGAVVRDGAFHKRVTNLGWLIRNWTLVESFDLYPHPPQMSRSMSSDMYMVARLRDGRTYETGYACFTVFCDWIARSRTLRDVPINTHPKLAEHLNKMAMNRPKLAAVIERRTAKEP